MLLALLLRLTLLEMKRKSKLLKRTPARFWESNGLQARLRSNSSRARLQTVPFWSCTHTFTTSRPRTKNVTSHAKAINLENRGLSVSHHSQMQSLITHNKYKACPDTHALGLIKKHSDHCRNKEAQRVQHWFETWYF